jgi:N-glycosylase/DNA lyase
LKTIARRVFSLDVDLDGFAREFAGEAELANGLAQGRGRILRASGVFEDAVKMLLTTNCSWAATRGMVVRLIAELGAEGRAFPKAEAIAAMTPARLKAKIRCGCGAITSERGFGPYAAEGLLRILGRHDFLAIDSWVRQEYRRRYRGPARTTDRAIARRYARYGAHRGLALWLDMTSHWHEVPSREAETWSPQVTPSLRS